MPKIIIQSSWCEEDDEELIDYIETIQGKDGIKYKVLSEEQIYSCLLTDIEVLFADSHIIQAILNGYLVNGSKIPDTYADAFKPFYHRNIRVIKFKESFDQLYPFFLKPKTHKSLVATVYDNGQDEYLKEIDIDGDIEVYISNVVTFKNEYRLFVSNYTSYSITNSSEFLLDDIVDIPPPAEFIAEVLARNIYKYVCIDVGFMVDADGKSAWTIVEVNPPFSLSSYNLPIDTYYKFCRDAWRWLIE